MAVLLVTPWRQCRTVAIAATLWHSLSRADRAMAVIMHACLDHRTGPGASSRLNSETF